MVDLRLAKECLAIEYTASSAMFEMSTLDLVLLAVGGYLAVITLVRLMQRRREGIIKDLTREVELEQERLKEERKKEKRRKMREQIELQQEQQQRQRRGAA